VQNRRIIMKRKKKIRVIVRINEVMSEESVVSFETTENTFYVDAMSAAVQEAVDQGWDVDDITIEYMED